MFGTFTLALAVTVADPRPDLIELQLAGKSREALTRVEQELEQRPEASRKLGLGYLQGHLFDSRANSTRPWRFSRRPWSATPALRFYSRYRLALDQDRWDIPRWPRA